MQQNLRIVEIGTPSGGIVAPEWLARAEAVHRQLRPGLPADYAGRIATIVRGGAVMVAAVRADRVAGVAVYRFFDNTHAGLRCYVDDLVTDSSERSSGVGKALVEYLQAIAGSRSCRYLELESGLQRSGAHRFYLREGFVIAGFSFKKELQ
jgi:GNAT superfamily N-acetyltransferase